MMRRSLAGFVSAVACLALSGCPAANDAGVKDADRDPAAAQSGDLDPAPAAPSEEDAAPAAAVPPVEPAIRYLPLDAPEGMSQAVVVQGFPLLHTRQLLPLDGDGQLVGEGSAEQQVEQVLANLDTVLQAAGSRLDKLVKLNVYADAPATADLLREKLATRLVAGVRPAITAIVSPLPVPQARIAVDAVALAAGSDSAVSLKRVATLAGDPACADAAVMPRGGSVYLSGQAEKGELAAAAEKSLSTLLKVLEQLKLERSQVVQMRVFLQPAASADEVLTVVKRLFPDQLAPPVIFAEWIASAPVEIELIAHLPMAGGMAQTVRYYVPPGAKPSPTFSPVGIVQTERVIYISGLTAREPGSGEAQVRDVFAQLNDVLGTTGSDLLHLVKATYCVSDEDASTMLNKLRPEFFDPQRPPAASKVTVHGVAHPDRTLTMDMIAVPTDP